LELLVMHFLHSRAVAEEVLAKRLEDGTDIGLEVPESVRVCASHVLRVVLARLRETNTDTLAVVYQSVHEHVSHVATVLARLLGKRVVVLWRVGAIRRADSMVLGMAVQVGSRGCR
jgi:hypothetical protein